MSDRLKTLLETRPVLLADGGMGTGLFALGLTTGDSPELWNVEHPERVAAVHKGFVDAGSDIILTNSFGGNRLRLKLHELQDRVGELNRAAARVARAVADVAGRPVVVAGSMGPTGELIAPLGSLGADEAEEAFAEQARALAEGGVDVLWIETMSSAEEVEAAVKGAARTGLPIVTTLSFDTNGRTMMGVTPEAAVALAHRLPQQPVAFGANCGTGPGQLLATVLGLKAAAGPNDVVVAKGNCGIPEYKDGHIHYSGTPEIMADYARLARACGARIVGGCCGTTAAHVAAMRKALDEGEAGPVPDISTIAAALGPVVVPGAAAGEAEPRAERRRRRG
ncbi:betaine--homocysteine S-methyltransferase [Benzoatithermus flavus]|uniref:Betaine--homocysteine S-methyltransferase n=1 Tax=Benzoatithermus flavus TaxID=3108223 RepID=A0ABU8XY43_9PROT